jgi:hypothetical protein
MCILEKGNQIIEEKMGGSWNMDGRDVKYAQNFGPKT